MHRPWYWDMEKRTDTQAVIMREGDRILAQQEKEKKEDEA